MKTRAIIIAALIVLCLPLIAFAQNPIRWHQNARTAVARAREQQLPVMFWVTEARRIGDSGDIRDAQGDSFRDPRVVEIAEHHFIPVRVSRNSRVLAEAQRLGLPTNHGLFVAIVTADGRVLDQIDPGQVANPEVFAQRLTAAFRTFRDDLYERSLKGVITSPDSTRTAIRRALNTIWRLNILSSDRDLVALLDRDDFTPVERQRLYGLLASFATDASVNALLTRAVGGDADAAAALRRAEPAALEFLIAQLPTADSATPIQIAAYEAAIQLVRRRPRPATFWTDAPPEERARELESLRNRATGIREYWEELYGRWR